MKTRITEWREGPGQQKHLKSVYVCVCMWLELECRARLGLPCVVGVDEHQSVPLFLPECLASGSCG